METWAGGMRWRRKWGGGLSGVFCIRMMPGGLGYIGASRDEKGNTLYDKAAFMTGWTDA